MSEADVRIAAAPAERADAFAVRERVFVDEQGVDPDVEYDDHDGTATHLVAYDGATPLSARTTTGSSRSNASRSTPRPAARAGVAG